MSGKTATTMSVYTSKSSFACTFADSLQTFFEMLGNWSFGDYFKQGAIEYSWDLLTKVYGIPADRLYVTYFEGKPDAGLEPDLEAKKIWLSVGVAEDHILPGDMKDNFWEMGEQGPCGPCSEVHYDRIGGRNAAHLVNQDDPDVLEIWNNVFIQYNREPDRSLTSLPNKHIDTGLGFERLVSVLQNKRSNYDTDVFTPLFETIQKITGAREYRGKFGDEDSDGIDTAYRVIADHVRTLTFAISDGAPPNNDGRGYVVRRILRRGARYARKYFNTSIGEFFSKIVPTLVEQMSEQFPGIKKDISNVLEILNEEEVSFAKTLDRGEQQFEHYAQKAKQKDSKNLHGADVWRVSDTFGFRVDLPRILADERHLDIDDAEFEDARLKAREASKGQKKAASDLLKLDVHDLNKLSNMKEVPETDDDPKYGRENITAHIKQIYHNKTFLETTEGIAEGDQIGVILNRTNFYAEQGGQEYDTGRIVIDGVADFEVQNVQTYAKYVLHTGFLKYGVLSTGNEVICEYDELRRWPIRNNHTGTHILNLALREVLGDSIEQRGSLVAPEKLRFDFSHKSAISDQDLEKVQQKSNTDIEQNLPVYSKEVPLATAEQILGVRAVFGEKYPDPVRVVSVGVEIDDLLSDVKNEEWKTVSVEFCGGTHVANTAEIKSFVIVEENGIAKGIRRIIAVTGEEANRVKRVALEFSERLTALEKLPYGPEKEQSIKTTQFDLNQLVVSALTKNKLRDQFATIAKAQLEEAKANQKAESRRVQDIVSHYFATNPDAKLLVQRVSISPNSKAVSDAIKAVQSKNKDKTVYLLGADVQDGKVSHGCHVSEVSFTSLALC